AQIDGCGDHGKSEGCSPKKRKSKCRTRLGVSTYRAGVIICGPTDQTRNQRPQDRSSPLRLGQEDRLGLYYGRGRFIRLKTSVHADFSSSMARSVNTEQKLSGALRCNPQNRVCMLLLASREVC